MNLIGPRHLCVILLCAVIPVGAVGLAETTVSASSSGHRGPPALEEVVITATRGERSAMDTPAVTHTVTSEDIRHRQQSRTVPEALLEIAGVMVQKTSLGQGSPFIRGFTGFRTLFLIDGIRLNNSVFREGANQYTGTVDPLTVQSLEVIKGPSSALYGSDAIGGTMNAITRRREQLGTGILWDRRLYYRYASAEDSHVGRAEVSGSLNERAGFLFGGSFKDFGDLEGGRDTGLQRDSGYDEQNGDFKVEYFFEPEVKLVLAHQRVNQNGVPRTHSTVSNVPFHGTTVGTDRKRDLDQNRELTYVRLEARELDWLVDEAQGTLSYHVQEEEQFRIRRDGRQDRQGFDAGTIGVGLQLGSSSPFGKWTYGAEYYRDHVESFARNFNADGSLRSVEIQGPVGDDAVYDLLGAYAQDEVEFLDRFSLILGGRYTYARADAKRVKDPVTSNQVSVEDDWNSLVGSTRLLCRLDSGEHWNVFGGVSQGFRAPNLSDLTRLDTARTNELEVPSPGVDPETFISYEGGLKVQYPFLAAQAAYFYTMIDDLIVRTPTGNVAGGHREVTKTNSGGGYVQGVELELSWRILPQWTAWGSFFWMEGYVDGFPGSQPLKVREPLDRLQPATGYVGLRWDHPVRKAWVEFVVALSERQDKLSAADREDTQRIPPDGTPGFAVFTLRGGWKLREGMVLSAALENLSDKDYRIHGSGVNEPGRNFVVSVDWRF
ncbi:MAG: TonB-dependent receptor [Planctomycetes bacterium]|nr:TonB-dependent receptor [Planctomycetota bacterium]